MSQIITNNTDTNYLADQKFVTLYQ